MSELSGSLAEQVARVLLWRTCRFERARLGLATGCSSRRAITVTAPARATQLESRCRMVSPHSTGYQGCSHPGCEEPAGIVLQIMPLNTPGSAWLHTRFPD